MMKREDIVKHFLDKGVLITPKVLEDLSKRDEMDINIFLEKEHDTIIRNSLSSQKHNFKIIKKVSSPPETMSVKDFHNFFKSKYCKIRDIFLKEKGKKYISIDKAVKTKEAWIIGMVMEKDDDEVVLEDLTGSIRVKTNEVLDLDDVVAVRIEKGQDVFAKEVVYPDVPLRSPKKGNGSAVFVSDLDLSKDTKWLDDVSALFIMGFKGDIKKLGNVNNVFLFSDKKVVMPNIVQLTDPSIIEFNGLNILICSNFDKDILKKRYLGFKNINKIDDMVLDVLPDIVLTRGNEQKNENYKTITIINTTKPTLINLETREVSPL